MTNVLNSIIANQPIYPQKKDNMPAFSFDSQGKIKPMKDKGTLLPSKIFGSPVEYVKDLKQDIVNIGKAAKGQANDHELGRINDVAMKLGSLGLAAYLFVKNPLKLSKTMEFVGFGTFFASMALWPKLAIQAPLKARTGVDIHQKYIDSQGRKKMLYQDPQYVLTDLYSKEDLERIGEKLKISKDIPDRDNFIKQRAQKTALQGNTLWMMTAGIASPVMSALACNQLEKPINSLIEKVDMASSERALATGKFQGAIGRMKQKVSDMLFERFLAKNADRVMDDKLISELTGRIGGKANSAMIGSAIKEELSGLRGNVTIDLNFVKNALQGKVDASVIDNLPEELKTALNDAIANKSFDGIGKILSRAIHGTAKRKQERLSGEIVDALTTKANVRPTLGQVTGTVRKLYTGITEFAKGKGAIDRFITARVGDKSGTYIANQWSKVGKSLMKSMKFSMKELRALADGDMSVLLTKLDALADKPEEYDKVVSKLMKLIGDYEAKTGEAFAETVKTKTGEICTAASENLKKQGFKKVAEKIGGEAKSGTLNNLIQSNASERALGAQSSFYRLIQSLDIFKRVKGENIDEQLRKAIIKAGGTDTSEDMITRLKQACKDVLLSATTTDHVEKLKTAGFGLSEVEYKAVTDVISSNPSLIEESIKRTAGETGSKGILKGLKKYGEILRKKVFSWKNEMTPDLSRRVVDTVEDAKNVSNAVERNNIIGKPIQQMFQDFAKETYNSRKWLHIFGGTMVALTAVTLIAGLAIGRKGKTEKQVEEESRRNG